MQSYIKNKIKIIEEDFIILLEEPTNFNKDKQKGTKNLLEEYKLVLENIKTGGKNEKI